MNKNNTAKTFAIRKSGMGQTIFHCTVSCGKQVCFYVSCQSICWQLVFL